MLLNVHWQCVKHQKENHLIDMNWKQILAPAMKDPKVETFKKWLKSERENKTIYPGSSDVFRAFDLCPYEQTRVIIFGQDPYHSPGTADGLAFSTRQDKIPPSLMVIFREIYRDLNIQYFHNITMEEFFPTGNLESWAKMGFLLMNTTLTVEEGKANSHKDMGWEVIVDAVIDALNDHTHNLIFCLWGNEAKSLKGKIGSKHMILEAAHPAAELYNPGQKAGFYWSRHFSIIRDILPVNNGRDPRISVNLEDFFDRNKAVQMVKKHYPIDADHLTQYILEELIVHAPVSKERYYEKLKKFEVSLSTKIN